jgi:hypothetical protein
MVSRPEPEPSEASKCRVHAADARWAGARGQ